MRAETDLSLGGRRRGRVLGYMDKQDMVINLMGDIGIQGAKYMTLKSTA